MPKKTRGETAVLQLTLRFGNEKSLAGQTSAAGFLGPLMIRGTNKHTRQQLKDELDKLGARLSASSDAGAVRFTLEAKKKNLPQAVALLKEVLRSPSFPAEEFEVMKNEDLTQIKQFKSDPQSLAVTALRRTLNPYPKDDIRYFPTIEETIARLESVTLDQVKQLYAKQLGGQDSTLVLVGDFADDPGKAPFVEELLTLLKGWKAQTPYRAHRETGQAGSQGRATGDPDAGQGKRRLPGQPHAGHDRRSPGFRGPGSRQLPLRRRQPLFATWQSRPPERGPFLWRRVAVPCRLQGQERQFPDVRHFQSRQHRQGGQGIAEELAMILKDGIPAKELEEAKTAYLKRRKVRRSTEAARPVCSARASTWAGP